MHSRIILRETSRLSIHRLRAFSNQSEPSISSSLRSHKLANNNKHPDPFDRSFSNGRSFTSSSSFLILGSGFGLCYWLSSSSSSSSSNVIAFADSHPAASSAFPDEFPQFHSSDPNKQLYLFGDDYRKRVFFNYEGRIRMQSPPEKVFEYFATIRAPDGELFMTPGDMMRAVVPVFPPSESNFVRGGHLKGERSPGDLHCPPSEFFMLFDTDNDGLISFPEYIFLVTLLSIPEASFTVAFKMFDTDNSGEIEREEFKKVIALMRTYNRQGKQHRDGKRNGLIVHGSVENGGVVEYFFGKDGQHSLPHGKFIQFLHDLRNEIVRLEFAHYDCNTKGSIPAKDFAMSMVASADMNHTGKLLDRVDELSKHPVLSKIRISYEEFMSFAELRRSIRSLSLALFSQGEVNGVLTKQDFQRAASNVCGIPLTNNVVDIIFDLFDTNRDGHLGSEEFLKVLERREKDLSVSSSADGLLSCCLDCFNK